jgi:osmoprotectant transport system substrate-binding protein
MKKTILALMLILIFSVPALACVGRTLTIGSLDSADEKLLSHLLSVMINERTGTNVTVEHFASQQALYEAVKRGDVTIFPENTGRALQLLGRKAAGDEEAVYLTVKEELKSQFDLVSLNRFGRSLASPAGQPHVYYMPVVAAGILVDYPALPRVINRLAGISEDKDYPGLISAVEAGGKPNRIARDFLKKKRLI